MGRLRCRPETGTVRPIPVGEVFEEQTLPNGLHLRKQRVPLGVLAVIYEARPNVTVDVAGLALKSGNCAVLRGGSETIHSNRAMAAAIRRGLQGSAIPADAIQLIADTDRGLVYELLQMDRYRQGHSPRGADCTIFAPDSYPGHHWWNRDMPFVRR